MSVLSDFLIDNDAAYEFVHNCRAHAHFDEGDDLPDEDLAVVDFMYRKEGSEAINSAFSWSDTREGHPFWSDLNEMYCSAYEDSGETQDYNIMMDF